MSRQTATVLFTDLVGSTELRGRLGEEAADALRRKHDQLLAQAVEAHNGRVVKGLGDGIMATFAGASDAVAAAVAIQQGIDRLSRSGKAPIPLSVRVGLSAGDVAFEDDDVHGTPVIEASRLCGAAVGGEVLASDIVRWLGGAQGALSLTPVGSLELKGLAEPIPTVRVEWEPVPMSTIPLPALLTNIGRIFVGRGGELERLQQLWKEASAGERRVALLAGEPGVGKTRLAAELAIEVHQEGGVVLAGRCDEDLGVPYQPFVEALRHFVDYTLISELKERLGRYGSELGRLVPELTDRAAGLPAPLQSDPETERYRLFDAVAAWLSVASAEEPVLLVLDDLQWAAKPTLLLLRHVVRASDARRLLILCTYRDTELTHDHPLVELVADLRRDGVVERFPLTGLDDLAVAAIVEQAAGHDLDEDGTALARAIYQETDGNPFFVREVLRHLAETNAIERQGDRWRTKVPIEQLGIPEGIRDVIGRRLSRLSGSANQALRIAAVVGGEFEIDLLEATGELAENELLRALEEAVEARLVSELSPTRFRFYHALVRATLYESLTGARRLGVHRRAAEAIERLHDGALDDYLPALAYHWANATAPADTDRAVEYARRAGDRALSQLAHHEAIAYYRQALELLDAAGAAPDDERRQDLLIALGEAQQRSGDPAHRQTLLVAARIAQSRGDAHALARAALTNTRGVFFSAAGAVDSERVAVVASALDAIGEEDSPVRARLLATLGVELTFAPERERRTRLNDEALALARRLEDPGTLAYVLLARRYTIAAPDTLVERLGNSAELTAVADQIGDPMIQALAAWVRYRTMLESGDLHEADHWLDVLARRSDELGRPNLRWLTVLTRAGRMLLAGSLEAAETAIDEAWQLGEATGQPDTALFCRALECQLSLERGRLGGREGAVPNGAAHASEAAAQAVLCLELGRHEDARDIFERLAVSRFADLPLDTTWLPTVVQCAILARRLEKIEEAEILHELLVPYHDQVCVHAATVCLGAVSHYLGVVATGLRIFDEAEARLAEAEAIHQRLGGGPWLARTHLEWARMLLARRGPGDADRARKLVGQALAAAGKLGLAKVAGDAVALLQECP